MKRKAAPLYQLQKFVRRRWVELRWGKKLSRECEEKNHRIGSSPRTTTTVAQNQGLLKSRKKTMSMAALIPGLQIKVDGHYDENKMLVAKTVTFNGNDLERAYSIQAGLSETEARSKTNQEAAAKHAAELAKQNAALAAQNAALQEHQAELKEHERKIAANKTLIEANSARFGQLDDYYIYEEVTVSFGNGKSKVDPQYNSQLQRWQRKPKRLKAI